MDVLAFIASPFAASTCPPRLRAAIAGGTVHERALPAAGESDADTASATAGTDDAKASAADFESSTTTSNISGRL